MTITRAARDRADRQMAAALAPKARVTEPVPLTTTEAGQLRTRPGLELLVANAARRGNVHGNVSLVPDCGLWLSEVLVAEATRQALALTGGDATRALTLTPLERVGLAFLAKVEGLDDFMRPTHRTTDRYEAVGTDRDTPFTSPERMASHIAGRLAFALRRAADARYQSGEMTYDEVTAIERDADAMATAVSASFTIDTYDAALALVERVTEPCRLADPEDGRQRHPSMTAEQGRRWTIAILGEAITEAAVLLERAGTISPDELAKRMRAIKAVGTATKNCGGPVPQALLCGLVRETIFDSVRACPEVVEAEAEEETLAEAAPGLA